MSASPSERRQRGKFITFEGIDGAGKSSHIADAAALLRGRGLNVLTTREPGGTALGEKLRELLLHEAMHVETEALLMFAARREHLERVIEPALACGDWVICDRFSDATYAYQSGGRGLDKTKFAQLENWVHGHLQPDLTLLFDLPSSIASQRIAAQERDLDRFEQERAEFHERVRLAYLERATVAAQRIRCIDANQVPDKIKIVIQETIIKYCL
ncbi:MAG: dTMP kinase [Candidatus Accumulibacter meliphilus]|uniref:dTMP kinase n=1 Tax=Candidatus Accumulibacter meliphilus TaxID=2211374 RepID=UPI002FC32439